MNYYKVDAKCGHVGRGHYIVKEFFVKAESGKDAARKVRLAPRVKHDWKDAIISVEQIMEEEFIQGRARQNNDLYFKVTNSSDQRARGAIDFEQVIVREEPVKKKRDKDNLFYNKLKRIQQRDLRIRLGEVC